VTADEEQFLPVEEVEEPDDAADQLDIEDPGASAEEAVDDAPEEEAGDELEPETEPEPESDEDPPEDEEDSGKLVDEVERLGIPRALAETMTPEQLRQAVETMDAPAEGKPAEQDDGTLEKYEVGLDDAVFDDEIVGEFRKMSEHVNNQLEVLQDQYGVLLQQYELDQQKEVTGWLDDRFDELGEAYNPVFGTGRFDEIDESSSEFKNRRTVAVTMDALAERYPNATREELFRKGVLAEFGNNVTQAERDKIKKQLRSQRTFSRRPTGRTTSADQSPRDRAVQAVADRMGDMA
jgi:hypothetical protein